MPDRAPAGPVDIAVLTFDTEVPPAELTTVVAAPVAAGAARLLDALVVVKAADGSTTTFDVTDETDTLELIGFPADLPGLITAADVEEVADALPPSSSAVVLAWENTWATLLAAALAELGGQVALHARITADDLVGATTGAADDES